ncbi:MAG: hypothetical protein IFK92_01630 [Acidobacteria bacterium]|nr:hypothetical protein [Candidatus Sulfomarinibacter kjeldsenii]
MLRTPVVPLIFILFVAVGTSAGDSFEDSFENATLRIDYHHIGNAEKEIVTIDRLYRQGAWAGPMTRLIDGFPYGGYRVEGRDPESDALLATEPAKNALVLETHISGPPHKVLDIAILGEGYTLEDLETFKTDLKRATEVLLGHDPFDAHRSQISVRGVMVPSAGSGCDEPTRGAFRSTPLGATFNSLGSERYMLTEDNRAVRDIAANVPYDALVIMVNNDRYGGGGIYNLFCTFTAHSEWADYLLLHEFGHSFAGLADEYYSSSVAYNDFYPKGHEPKDANITALLDPEKLKWRDLVDPDTEIPTPWEKEAYDHEDAAYQEERKLIHETIAEASTSGAPAEKIAELEDNEARHAAIHAQWAQEYLARSEWVGTIGAFEGAGYSSAGLYRPALDCLMFSRRVQPFCRVCERAVDAMVLQYVE